MRFADPAARSKAAVWSACAAAAAAAAANVWNWGIFWKKLWRKERLARLRGPNGEAPQADIALAVLFKLKRCGNSTGRGSRVPPGTLPPLSWEKDAAATAATADVYDDVQLSGLIGEMEAETEVGLPEKAARPVRKGLLYE